MGTNSAAALAAMLAMGAAPDVPPETWGAPRVALIWEPHADGADNPRTEQIPLFVYYTSGVVLFGDPVTGGYRVVRSSKDLPQNVQVALQSDPVLVFGQRRHQFPGYFLVGEAEGRVKARVIFGPLQVGPDDASLDLVRSTLAEVPSTIRASIQFMLDYRDSVKGAVDFEPTQCELTFRLNSHVHRALSCPLPPDLAGVKLAHRVPGFEMATDDGSVPPSRYESEGSGYQMVVGSSQWTRLRAAAAQCQSSVMMDGKTYRVNARPVLPGEVVWRKVLADY